MEQATFQKNKHLSKKKKNLTTISLSIVYGLTWPRSMTSGQRDPQVCASGKGDKGKRVERWAPKK